MVVMVAMIRGGNGSSRGQALARADDGHSGPWLAGGRRDVAGVQDTRDRRQRLRPLDGGGFVRCRLLCIAEHRAARLGARQGVAGADSDLLAFELGNGREDVDRQLVGVRV
jgi:hypothetical protein